METNPTGIENQPTIPSPGQPGVNPPPTLQNPEANIGTEKWKSVLTIICLVIVPLGLLGIIFTWVLTNWSKTAKILITVLYPIFIFFFIIILGILSATVFIGMGSTRQKLRDTQVKAKLRDTQVKANLRYISNSLELYYDDNSKIGSNGIAIGSYPAINSFNSMKYQLMKAGSFPEIKNTGSFVHIYKYCSNDGSKFNLSVSLESASVPFTVNSAEGADTCTPGE
ncbi:MAG: hypothetical protein Q7S37_01155 [bacterium]|nr:hypothetical protein [bacterium]